MDKEYDDRGFQAIMDKVIALYDEEDGNYFGVQVPYCLGGKDPLDQVAVFKSEKDIPHWHYVTFGFSELYEKESDNEEYSGFGFELTFRLKCGDEDKPPIWPINLLQNLARYVFQTGNYFDKNQHMDINGPIALEEDTKIMALGFDIDNEMGSMETPNGHVDFLQVIGLTLDELEGMMLWNGENFLKLFRSVNPMGVTILERDSYLDNVDFREKLEAGVERDGSSTGMLYVSEIDMEVEEHNGMKVATLKLGAGHIEKITKMLKARLSKNRELYLKGANIAINFVPEETPGFGLEDDFGVINLNEKCLQEFMLLQPHTGMIAFRNMPLVVDIVPTYIKDQDGNVIRTIE